MIRGIYNGTGNTITIITNTCIKYINNTPVRIATNESIFENLKSDSNICVERNESGPLDNSIGINIYSSIYSRYDPIPYGMKVIILTRDVALLVVQMGKHHFFYPEYRNKFPKIACVGHEVIDANTNNIIGYSDLEILELQ